jgi:uncharacterized membrane protein YhaH (DUF805 family)
MRQHATKLQLRVATAGWVVMNTRIGATPDHPVHLTPFGQQKYQTNAVLWNALCACRARPQLAITLFATYEDALAAIRFTIAMGRKRFRDRLKSDWPAWMDRKSWTIFAVGNPAQLPPTGARS